jgi:hypothetical protein
MRRASEKEQKPLHRAASLRPCLWSAISSATPTPPAFTVIHSIKQDFQTVLADGGDRGLYVWLDGEQFRTFSAEGPVCRYCRSKADSLLSARNGPSECEYFVNLS